MDPDIGHPYVDQFVVTLEHQLAEAVIVGFDYINRKSKDIPAMITSNVDGYDALVAPGNPLTGGDLPFYELIDPPEFLITNPAAAYRDYQGAIVRLAKRYRDGWSLDASLTWADLEGNADYGFNSYVDEFEDLNGLVNAEGPLPYNSEWVLKLSSSVDLPGSFMLAGYYQYQTGEYWTPYVRIRGLYENDRSNVLLTPRGSEQYDDRSVLDLHLEWFVDLSEDMRLTLMLDGFNVFDSEKVTSVAQRWGDYRYDWRDHPDGSEWRPSSSFMQALSIQTPREVRVAAKLSF
jgi:hypothetical protein